VALAQDMRDEAVRAAHAALAEARAAMEAEAARLRAEAEAARRVIDSAIRYAIVTLDPDGRITGWSAGAEAILGHPAAEAVGRSGDIVLVPEDRAEGGFGRLTRRVLEEGPVTQERWCLRRDGGRFWASGAMMPLREGGARGVLMMLHDASEAQARAERSAMLLAGMGQRVRGTLAVVGSLASRTARHAARHAAAHQAEGLERFEATFRERLAALGRAHDALLDGGWESATLRDAIARALRPHEGAPGRLTMDGPPVRLAAEPVLMLGLALHELAANAAEHGALSMDGGRVSVLWALRRLEGGQRAVELVWQERGGPRARRPERQGFGTRFLERGFAQEFGGTVRLDFAPQGVECRIVLPLTARVVGAPPR